MRAPFARPVWRTAALRAGAAACLLIGYADLARGGLTLAPVLLVLGYLIFIPVAFMRS